MPNLICPECECVVDYPFAVGDEVIKIFCPVCGSYVADLSGEEFFCYKNRLIYLTPMGEE